MAPRSLPTSHFPSSSKQSALHRNACMCEREGLFPETICFAALRRCSAPGRRPLRADARSGLACFAHELRLFNLAVQYGYTITSTIALIQSFFITRPFSKVTRFIINSINSQEELSKNEHSSRCPKERKNCTPIPRNSWFKTSSMQISCH